MGLKRMFVVAGLSLMSALVPEGSNEKRPELGQRVIAIRALDYRPFVVIAKGERGTIDYINDASGLLEVHMDTKHAGLANYDNHIWLAPFENDETENCLQLISS